MIHDFQFSSSTRPGSTLVVCLCLAVCLIGAPTTNAEADSPRSENSDNAAEKSYDNPLAYLGSWIWASNKFDNQVCQLWRGFEVPAGKTVRQARLRMTVDNEFVLYLDGRELGRGAEWRELFDFDVTSLLSPGQHTLAVSARNSFSYAGFLFGLHIQLSDGGLIEIKSDESWHLVPDGQRDWKRARRAEAAWPAATVIAPFGSAPWRDTPINVNVMPVLQPIELRFWQTGWFQALSLSVCGIVILFSLWLMAQLALHKKERLLLERERARIAMDIHDDLGSKMTQLVLHGEVLQNDLAPKSDLRTQLDVICDDARRMLSTLDEILWAVNPRRDTLSDFSSYVCGYVEEALKHTTIECRFDVDSEVSGVALDMPVRRMLLMAIKETLNNAVKYSKASELLLGIKCNGKKLTVVVQDDGKGFDPRSIKPGRHGLKNMAHRMNELGGMCLVLSEPGKGCRVEFSLALKPSRKRPFAWIWKSKTFPAVKSDNENEPVNASVPNP